MCMRVCGFMCMHLFDSWQCVCVCMCVCMYMCVCVCFMCGWWSTLSYLVISSWSGLSPISVLRRLQINLMVLMESFSTIRWKRRTETSFIFSICSALVTRLLHKGESGNRGLRSLTKTQNFDHVIANSLGLGATVHDYGTKFLTVPLYSLCHYFHLNISYVHNNVILSLAMFHLSTANISDSSLFKDFVQPLV